MKWLKQKHVVSVIILLNNLWLVVSDKLLLHNYQWKHNGMTYLKIATNSFVQRTYRNYLMLQYSQLKKLISLLWTRAYCSWSFPSNFDSNPNRLIYTNIQRKTAKMGTSVVFQINPQNLDAARVAFSQDRTAEREGNPSVFSRISESFDNRYWSAAMTSPYAWRTFEIECDDCSTQVL